MLTGYPGTGGGSRSRIELRHPDGKGVGEEFFRWLSKAIVGLVEIFHIDHGVPLARGKEGEPLRIGVVLTAGPLMIDGIMRTPEVPTGVTDICQALKPLQTGSRGIFQLWN